MKIIDLLNKIANGEDVPKKIKYNNIIYDFDDRQSDYEHFALDHYDYFLDDINIFIQLNEEVEIIEDKKIEKIEKLYKYIDKEIDEKEKDMYYENILKVYDGSEYEIDESMSFVVDKINEIIDKLNSMEE